MNADVPHAACRAQLLAFTSGLLEAEDEERFRRHLAECAVCRAAVDAFHEGAGTDDPAGGHLPARLVARWDRARHELRGMERALVREHLEDCAECRQDLEALGFPPDLERVPELELAPGVLREPAGSAPRATVRGARPPMPAEPSPVRVALSPPRRRSWARWALGGWAAAATAAVLLLLLDPGPDRMSLGPSRAPSPQTGPAVGGEPPGGTMPHFEPAAELRLRVDLVGPPWLLRTPRRGEPGPEVVIPITEETRQVPLSVAGAEVPEGDSVEVEVVSGAGAVLCSATFRQEDFYPRKIVMLGGAGGPLPPGPYLLRLRAIPGPDALLGTAEVVEYRFELRLAPGPRGSRPAPQ